MVLKMLTWSSVLCCVLKENKKNRYKKRPGFNSQREPTRMLTLGKLANTLERNPVAGLCYCSVTVERNPVLGFFKRII